ncbi:MAG: site-specific integrase [Limisphaerales bacterium]
MNTKPILSGGSSGPLFPYINFYLTQIKEQGYAVGSHYEQVHVLKVCDRWLKRTGREVRDLDESVARECLRRAVKGGYGKNAGSATLCRLLAMLRRLGVTPEVEAELPSPSQQLVGAYEHYLLKERNLSWQSVVPLRRFANRFLFEKFGDDQLNLSKLSAPDVTAFVQRHAHRYGPSEARKLVAAMRSFLRYLHYKGQVDTDLSVAVPKVARWSLSNLPKHLSAAQVRQVLRHCDRNTALGRRNYAILLLLARLGLRAGEVVSLNLEDIDWDNTRITVCGKTGRWAQLPLPADVARAIANYLHRDRPHCACRRVFIRDRAPIGGFNCAHAISSMVKRALVKAGVVSGRKGAHLLRHSLATDMLRKGASLDEIGEVLRHKSPDSTAIYAKVDLGSLRTLALPWPGGAR